MQPRQMNPFRYLEEMAKICSIHSGTVLPPGMETNALYEASQDSRQRLPGCVADDLPGVRWHCNLCEDLKKNTIKKETATTPQSNTLQNIYTNLLFTALHKT